MNIDSRIVNFDWSGRNWRLGFQIGNISLANELKLYAEIQFKDSTMRDAFETSFANMAEDLREGVTICRNSKANTINITWDKSQKPDK